MIKEVQTLQRVGNETTLGHIYKITNLINGKVYIGQTIQSIKDRWYRHVGNSKWLSQHEVNMAIKRAIIKYGKENFKLELIENCKRENLNDREKYWISYYDSYHTGYNNTLGGQDGFKSFKNDEKECQEIIDLYKEGFSLREIGKEYNIDKATVKGILIRHNIELRNKRNYKYTRETLLKILEEYNNGVSRLDIQDKYKISRSYLSQLITGKRRI